MRNCIDDGRLQAWFDGELAASDAAQVAAHVDVCARCAETVRTLETENSIVSQGLAAEFAVAIPTDLLRQRIKAAIAGQPALNVPIASRSWASVVGDLFPPLRALAYASVAAAILIAGALALVYLKAEKRSSVAVQLQTPLNFAPTPNSSPETGPAPLTPKPSNAPKPRRSRPMKQSGAVEETATSLTWQERQYESAFAKLNEAIKAQAPMRPSMLVDYEYNLALIDNAIVTARGVARKNPRDPQAAQSMLTAYQSKIDLMNQIADARDLER